MNKLIYCTFIILLFCSCGSTKSNYNPTKKYAPEVLRNDYTLLRNILEKKHPALYWYTAKEKMDAYFDRYAAVIKDSMTEQQFAWLAVAPLLNKIKCGHTSMSLSKAYSKWAKGKIIPSFPLYMKVWNDSMFVYANLNFKKDSILKRGALVTSINGIPNKILIKYMFEFLSQDGYSDNVNYYRLSVNFPYYHRNVFGLSKKYTVTYIDSNGKEQRTIVPLFVSAKDSTKKDSIKKEIVTKVEKQKIPKINKNLQFRSLKIDSSKTTATLTLNTFSEGHLRRFFRQTFRLLKEQNIKHLIIDLRSNGGGKVDLSTLLTKYLSKRSFKISDSLYTPTRGLGEYTKYITGNFFNNIQMFLISRKKQDGNYHIKRLENDFFKPKKNGYDGNVYILTSGATFSASSIFCNALKGQQNITILGEETGGGWYGNSGIMIPTIVLPNTGVRVRLPLFKLVQTYSGQAKGSGVLPDVAVPTSYDALLKGYDKKMEEVKKIIEKSN